MGADYLVVWSTILDPDHVFSLTQQDLVVNGVAVIFGVSGHRSVVSVLLAVDYCAHC